MSFIDDLKSAVSPSAAQGEGETWVDRVKQAAYTPPSGIRITFDYENISYEQTKKTSVYEFSDADGALVQDHGIGSRRFPSRIIFWGKNYDKEAEVFEAALNERGIGKLESPLYGTHDVIPFSDYVRRDDLKDAANQAIFDVVFLKTLKGAYPGDQHDMASATMQSLENFGLALDADFASSIDQGSISEQKGLLDNVTDNVNKVKKQMKKVAAVQQVVNDEFEDAVDTVDNILTTFISDPLTLAYETRRMIQAPGTAMANISDRLEGFKNLASDIFTSKDAISKPGGQAGYGQSIVGTAGVGNDMQEPNKFHARKVFAMNYMAASVKSVLYTKTPEGGASSIPDINKIATDAERTDVAANNSFQTSSEALDAAESLLTQLDLLLAWIDDNYRSLDGGDLAASETAKFIMSLTNIDHSDALRYLIDSVALAAGFLIELSFILKRSKKIVLDRNRSLFDTCKELYGNTNDSTLDFFINSNKLAGSQILELEKGQEIVYYV